MSHSNPKIDQPKGNNTYFRNFIKDHSFLVILPFDESKSKEVYDSLKSIRDYYKQKYIDANTDYEDICGFYSETYDLDENGNK